MTEEESSHALETEDMFIILNSFIVTTPKQYEGIKKSEHRNYSSYGEMPISSEKLKDLLLNENLLF
ncbi:hypothetical protein D3C81_2182460 [compost metagenome]